MTLCSRSPVSGMEHARNVVLSISEHLANAHCFFQSARTDIRKPNTYPIWMGEKWQTIGLHYSVEKTWTTTKKISLKFLIQKLRGIAVAPLQQDLGSRTRIYAGDRLPTLRTAAANCKTSLIRNPSLPPLSLPRQPRFDLFELTWNFRCQQTVTLVGH